MKKSYVISVSILIILLIFSSRIIKTNESNVDHKEYLAGPFESIKEVTAACIECHEEQANEVLKSQHWFWLSNDSSNINSRGKRFNFNNLYININSGKDYCTSCHPSFSKINGNFDFKNIENIDCLICHDNTGLYSGKKKETTEQNKIELVKIAQSVGKTSSKNCLNCHFFGGKGMEIKHGDDNPSLLNNVKFSDIHIDEEKLDCIDCHITQKHKIRGSRNNSESDNNFTQCIDCHDNDKKQIHSNSTIGKHLDDIACETCHIPVIAPQYYTLTNWDWSTAGKKEDEKFDENHLKYSKTEGDFKWEKNIIPVYQWFNGEISNYKLADKINQKPMPLNSLSGSIEDSKSKITPFKLMKGKQIYDSENNYLIVPKLFGDNGFKNSLNWNTAAEIGMKEINLSYSGKFDFVETFMYLPINHLVSSKKDVLKCNDCHGKKGRMNWEELGYKEDPLRKGGRIKNKLMK